MQGPNVWPKYRKGNTKLSPYHQQQQIKKAISLKAKSQLYSCLMIVLLPFGSR